MSSPHESMLQKSDLNLIRKIFKSLPEVGAAACRRSPAAFCSRHHHALDLCQMDVQLFGHEEERKESRGGYREEGRGQQLLGFVQKTTSSSKP